MRSTILSALAACSLLLSTPPLQATPTQLQGPPEPVEELRGVWLTNVNSKVLSSRSSIAKAMDFLERTNINVVFPVVWSQGFTLYPSETAERYFKAPIHPDYAGRDVLKEVIEEAHAYGIAVIPWFEYGFTAGNEKLGQNLLKARPEWAAIGEDGRPVEQKGLHWMNSLDPEVQEFIKALMVEVAAKYDIEGIQGDDRLPALPVSAGYDEGTIARYKQETGKDAPKDFRDAEWVRWRADQLTAFLRGLRSSLLEVNPKLMISSAPSPPDWGRTEFLQDSSAWLREGLVDWIHPQVYGHTAADYKSRMTKILDEEYDRAQSTHIFPSILLKSGDYVITETDLVECIQWNRKHGIQGEVLFYYEGLLANKAIQKALLSGPYARPAIMPTLRQPEPSATAPK